MAQEKGSGELVRALDWKGAFWVAAGVPPLVLFSIGGIAGVAGKAAFVVWMISMVMGFLQSFTYAEMAGMFGNKSGGASVYGATAWLRYSKLIAPLSVWCNWFAWSPVLSLGCAIAAGYILNALFPIPAADSQVVLDWMAANAGKTAEDAVAALTPALRNWEAFSIGIPGLGNLHFNSTFVIGVILMLIIFAIQHKGIASTAKSQKVMALIVLIPLLLVGLVPILTGAIDSMNVTNIVPPTAAYSGEDGAWDIGGWTLFLGAMYIAAWSTYGFETAVCYTAEFKDPRTDTFRAIFYSGLLCIVFFFMIPFAFQGVLGTSGMLAPGIVDGTGIGEALGGMVGGGRVVTQIFVILMILALFLAIMTAMAGSSRTLYQGSRDGWLPRYLGHVNEHGAPTSAMWTDLGFNVFLLALASDATGYFYVLAISNVGYITFNFLNLNAGWIHRIDSGHMERPWKAPTLLIGVNTCLAFVNALFLGAGAKVWGYSNALISGAIFAALILPVFWFRHYVQDGGKFPKEAYEDLGLAEGELGERKAGILPYVALIAGVCVVLWANWFFQLPE
ncbi:MULTISPECIES: APC family permease [Gemmobacter]|jgi:amino acid transporter|uniref:Amino acid/polyamine/organocation transporter (APC superfamily) n=2 Tax=Gemmobacter TaxID=204456 RepID=A0A2T6B752_9RHOB|nr:MULTISPECIES: APC family permease [Gemmobacter]OJY28981.1 MAG: amino acid permease [Rhodobacterales bacterium 65-51]PTX51899.1 amino acid/polyamine/organocation transporter (APC superfamily) [Gemmobacter caeni]TWJ04027.1 amino acid transporter [Gemmobacter caeni]GHC10841.1 amino acid permease [Gemmobacter nanjingensis]